MHAQGIPIRYPIAAFEQFVENSPARIKRAKIAQLPLPEPRKPTTKVWDWFNERLSLCAAADSGERSEPDFALACFAVERGINRDEAWKRASQVGKFAERGEAYFDLTWTAAEQHTREMIYEKAIAKTEKKAATNGKPSVNGAAGQPSTTIDPLSEDKRICSELQIDVLGEMPDGAVKVWSKYFKKTILLPRVVFQTTTDMLQKFGPVIREKVHSGKEDVPGMYQLRRVQEAIALVGGLEPAGTDAELGQGVWRAKDDLIVLVNSKSAALWDGEKLSHIDGPRVAGLKIDMDLQESWRWFDFAKLAGYLDQAKDKKWSEDAIARAVAIFEKWNWHSTMAMAPNLVAGLVLCTFVQSCWTWRPLVAITAESDSGKSLFFETVATIFGPLALLNAKSTEAGIRQAVGQHAKAILCDEFESDNHRDKIMEFFRTASRGSQTLRGTSGQHAQRYGLRHIPWCAAVGIKLDRAPDRNRFIFLEFSPVSANRRGKIDLPSGPELNDLGQKLLAIAVRNACEADRLAARLKSLRIPETHGRVVESYSTPVAMIATAIGLSETESETLLRDIVGHTEQDPGQATKDQTELLADILGTEIVLERGQRATVGQILASKSEVFYPGGWAALERGGVGIGNDKRAGNETGKTQYDAPDFLFIAIKSAQRYLLRGTRWAQESVGQILLRLPGARHSHRRLGGQRPRGIDIPWQYVSEKFLSEDEQAF